MFKAARDELWVIGQIVMKGSRIVLPQKMQKQALVLAHEGHQDQTERESVVAENGQRLLSFRQLSILTTGCPSKFRADKVDTTPTGTLGRHRNIPLWATAKC